MNGGAPPPPHAPVAGAAEGAVKPGLRNWLRWEFGRRIEVTGVIVFIICERFVKALALVIGGIALLVVAGHDSWLDQVAQHLQDQLNLNPGSSFLRRFLVDTIAHFARLSTVEHVAIGVGAMLYGLLEASEGIGLLFRRRWAEYLVLVATAAFLPLEIDELLRHATWIKAAALVVNIAIVVYLVWRKRLFLERPGRPPVADRTDPEPAASADQR